MRHLLKVRMSFLQGWVEERLDTTRHVLIEAVPLVQLQAQCLGHLHFPFARGVSSPVHLS